MHEAMHFLQDLDAYVKSLEARVSELQDALKQQTSYGSFTFSPRPSTSMADTRCPLPPSNLPRPFMCSYCDLLSTRVYGTSESRGKNIGVALP